MIYIGKAHKVGDNIDTDAIIPARFLVTTDPDELGANCMEGLEPGWVNRVMPGDILVAGRNFGCGSSREHAPVAIKGAGIAMVVAHSFARIFYRNGFNMGLILLEVGDEVDKLAEGMELEADTIKGEIKIKKSGETIKTSPVPEFMGRILDAGGLVGYVKQELSA